MVAINKILFDCPLFSGISQDDLQALLVCLDAKTKRYAKRETIASEGEKAQFVGIVLSGSVQISSIDYCGNRSIIGAAYPSELFGESFACAGTASLPIDVIAAEDAEILLIDCVRILNSCDNSCGFHRHLIFNLMQIIASKNLNFFEKIQIISKRTTQEKLMAYLLLCSKKLKSSSFDIPYDRQELADFLGVDRSGLSAEISKLCKAGVIKSRKNHFEIL